MHNNSCKSCTIQSYYPTDELFERMKLNGEISSKKIRPFQTHYIHTQGSQRRNKKNKEGDISNRGFCNKIIIHRLWGDLFPYSLLSSLQATEIISKFMSVELIYLDCHFSLFIAFMFAPFSSSPPFSLRYRKTLHLNLCIRIIFYCLISLHCCVLYFYCMVISMKCR